MFQKKIEKLFDPGFENHDSPGNAATLYRSERNMQYGPSLSPLRAFSHIDHLNILCKLGKIAKGCINNAELWYKGE